MQCGIVQVAFGQTNVCGNDEKQALLSMGTCI